MSAQDLARLHRAAFIRQRSWSAQEFDSLLAHPSTVLIRAGDGFGLIRIIAPEAELLTLAVAPSAQGQGLGKRLLDSLLTAAATFGASEMFLEVAADNAPALSLYRSTGFTRSGHRAGYFRYPDGGRADAILMRRATHTGQAPADCAPATATGTSKRESG